MLLDIQNVKKVYKTRAVETVALRSVDFGVNEGEYVSIMGESGSGKSTLLNIIATYDKPTEGRVLLREEDISDLPSSELAEFRRNHLGFVFQDFNLLDIFNNKDNILLPMVLSNAPVDVMESRVQEVASFLGISDLLEKFPYELSGGQRQRVAVARAIINEPDLLLADEPTGALDSKSSDQLLSLFEELNEAGNTILMVTHSIRAASRSKRVLFIKDGIIYHEIYRGDDSPVDFQERISDALAMLNRSEV